MKRSVWWAGMAAMLVVAGCSSVVPSLGPGLHDNAVAYDAAIGDINDRVLIANIARARDFVPLSITELSTVTGTLSAQANLGLSVPFGGNYGSTPRGTAMPSMQFSAAPTFSMAALNTRGFTLNIMQPISPVYIASKWNSGVSHELLLLLFVKDIQFADSYAPSLAQCAAHPTTSDGMPPLEGDSSGVPASDKMLIACHHKFVNNPDVQGEAAAFKSIIESMLPSVGLKVMTILEPIGPAFPFLVSPAEDPADGKKRIGKEKDAISNPLDAYALTTHLGDGQYHVGNSGSDPRLGQLYRVYPNQVAVCSTDPVRTNEGTFFIYPVGADIAAARHAENRRDKASTIPLAQDQEKRLREFQAQCASSKYPDDHACTIAKTLNDAPRRASGANAFGSYALSAAARAGAPADISPNESGVRGRTASGAAAGPAMATVSTSLQENRVGAFLRSDDCYADQTVREPTTETEFHKYTETLGHIEWRSIAEVFQYLGAVLRQPGGVTWNAIQDRDVVGSTSGAPESMFALRHAAGESGSRTLKIDYDGEKIVVGSGMLATPTGAFHDQSLQVLTLLNELVNSAKISSDIPVTQQLQVLP
jgi:hypothetical protein